LEVIKRVEGQKADKQIIPEGTPQISLNSEGRLVIRQIYSQSSDALVVLDADTSTKIIRFVQGLEVTFKDNALPF
jgi:hypothetical protein